MGVPPWALHLAAQTEALGLATLFVTGDQTERDRASDQGHLVYNGPLTPEDLAAATDAMGGATVLAASDREEANALALEWLAEHLGRPRLVHLPTAAAVDDHRNAKGTAMSAWGRELEGLVDQDDLRDRLERGWRFTTTTVGHREPDDIALVLSPAEGSPEIVTTDTDLDRHSDVAVVVLRAPA